MTGWHRHRHRPGPGSPDDTTKRGMGTFNWPPAGTWTWPHTGTFSWPRTPAVYKIAETPSLGDGPADDAGCDDLSVSVYVRALGCTLGCTQRTCSRLRRPPTLSCELSDLPACTQLLPPREAKIIPYIFRIMCDRAADRLVLVAVPGPSLGAVTAPCPAQTPPPNPIAAESNGRRGSGEGRRSRSRSDAESALARFRLACILLRRVRGRTPTFPPACLPSATQPHEPAPSARDLSRPGLHVT
jgi:hypothetical protein